jgi:nucleoside-diphosphate-sugar epimerase
VLGKREPEGSVTAPAPGDTRGANTKVKPDGTVVAPDGTPLGKVNSAGVVVAPDGTVLGKREPDGGVTAAALPKASVGVMTSLPEVLLDMMSFKSVFGSVDLSDKGLEDAFKALDTDGSGKCSGAELEAYIEKVHKKKLKPEAIAAMMAEADADRDGEVDLEEFKAIMRGAPKAAKEQKEAEKAAKGEAGKVAKEVLDERYEKAMAAITSPLTAPLEAVKAVVAPTKADKEKAARKKAAQKQGTVETWVSCDVAGCGKWRRANLFPSDLNQMWVCSDNPDERYNSCDKPQELSTKDVKALLGLDFSEEAPETNECIEAEATEAEKRGVEPAHHRGSEPNTGILSYRTRKASVPAGPKIPGLQKMGGGKAAGSEGKPGSGGVAGGDNAAADAAKGVAADGGTKPSGGFLGLFRPAGKAAQAEWDSAGAGADGRPTVLITGASGWIGKLLAQALVAQGGMRVVSLSKQPCDVKGVETVQSDLLAPGLDEAVAGMRVDCCVHLAGAPSGCKMAKGQEHNLIGTRRLMDALLPTGCRRFIVASSIGAVGTGLPNHPPKQLPMPDEEPYGGYPWPYALTKFQVEELMHAYASEDEELQQEAELAALPMLDLLVLRIGSCLTDPPGTPTYLEPAADTTEHLGHANLGIIDPLKGTPEPGAQYCFPEGSLAVIAVSDLIEIMRRAIAMPHTPGVRVRNATATHSFLRPGVSVPAVFRHWYGKAVDNVDFSSYERRGHEQDAIFDSSALQQELGYVPRVDVRTAYNMRDLDV